MAESFNTKSLNAGDKKGNTVTRTTLESVRPNDADKNSQLPFLNTQRKKNPAFQITSVTIGSRNSNDGGDDSGDDFDESHTDDMSDVVDSSRFTDIENETPSFSEDTFSKEDGFLNPATTTPVSGNVTSAQRSFNVLSSESVVTSSINSVCINSTKVSCVSAVTSATATLSPVAKLPGTVVATTRPTTTVTVISTAITSPTVTSSICTSTVKNPTTKATGDSKNSQPPIRTDRFRVVKIETTEPFKRGRWTCRDYSDQSAGNLPTFTSMGRPSAMHERTVPRTTTQKNDPNQFVQYIAYNEQMQRITLTLQNPTNNPATYTNALQGGFHAQQVYQNQLQQQVIHPQQLASSSGTQSIHLVSAGQLYGPQVIPSIQTQILTAQAVKNESHSKDIHGITHVPVQLLSPQPLVQHLKQQNVQQKNYRPEMKQGHTTQVPPATVIPVHLAMPSNSPSVNPQQGKHSQIPSQSFVLLDAYSYPVSVLQPVSYNGEKGQVQYIPCIPTKDQANVAYQVAAANQNTSDPSTSNPHKQRSSPQCSKGTQASKKLQQIPSVPQKSDKLPKHSNLGKKESVNVTNIVHHHHHHHHTVKEKTKILEVDSSSTSSESVSSYTPHQPSRSEKKPAPCEKKASRVPTALQKAATSSVPTTHAKSAEQDKKVETKDSKVPTATTEKTEQGAQKPDTTTKKEECESKPSTHPVHPVAIDNKIEQAMDLVKSHLMFAVREEVEILKLKIAELMERIAQLESENNVLRTENNILRFHVPPEIIQQVNALAISKNTPSGQSQSQTHRSQQKQSQSRPQDQQSKSQLTASQKQSPSK